MKKVTVLFLLFCFLGSFAFAQSAEQEKEELRNAMEQLRNDMEQLRQDLKVDLENLKIDLSGLDQLNNINLEDYPGYEEGMAYLDSEEFKQEMEKVKSEIDKAMEDVHLEMEELEKVNWEEINKVIEDAMKEMEEELSKIKEDD